MTFLALCRTRTAHFTTITAFVSGLGPDIGRVFAAVLAVCDQQGPIGRQMFAIDGVKLPSNASERRSWMRSDFERQAEMLEAASARMLGLNQVADAKDERGEPPLLSPRTTRSSSRGYQAYPEAVSSPRKLCASAASTPA